LAECLFAVEGSPAGRLVCRVRFTCWVVCSLDGWAVVLGAGRGIAEQGVCGRLCCCWLVTWMVLLAGWFGWLVAWMVWLDGRSTG